MTGRLIRAFTDETLLDGEAQQLKPYLSAYTKQMSAAGQISVLDTEDSTEVQAWRVAARGHAEMALPERIRKLLRLFTDRSAYMGDAITVDSRHDYPMIDAIRADELFFLLEHLRSRGDIEWPLLHEPDGQFRQIPVTREPLTRARLTLQGWERVQMNDRERVTSMLKEFDVFICHAGEDKADVALPLARRLRDQSYEVWYDDFVLKVGDSLRRRIDGGLAHSRFGIVIVSPAFFDKEWPQKELDGLVAREIGGVKVSLPIWHQINATGVVAKSPTLADRVAARTEEGLDEVVRKIVDVLGPPRASEGRDAMDSTPRSMTARSDYGDRP